MGKKGKEKIKTSGSNCKKNKIKQRKEKKRKKIKNRRLP